MKALYTVQFWIELESRAEAISLAEEIDDMLDRAILDLLKLEGIDPEKMRERFALLGTNVKMD